MLSFFALDLELEAQKQYCWGTRWASQRTVIFPPRPARVGFLTFASNCSFFREARVTRCCGLCSFCSGEATFGSSSSSPFLTSGMQFSTFGFDRPSSICQPRVSLLILCSKAQKAWVARLQPGWAHSSLWPTVDEQYWHWGTVPCGVRGRSWANFIVEKSVTSRSSVSSAQMGCIHLPFSSLRR